MFFYLCFPVLSVFYACFLFHFPFQQSEQKIAYDRQVVETECTQDAADSDEEAHEDKEPVMGGDPEDAPKKYTEKADCTDGNQLCEKWFWHKVPSFNMYEMWFVYSGTN